MVLVTVIVHLVMHVTRLHVLSATISSHHLLVVLLLLRNQVLMHAELGVLLVSSLLLYLSHHGAAHLVVRGLVTLLL